MSIPGNGRYPSWLWPTVLTVLFGLVAYAWRVTDGKADTAQSTASRAEATAIRVETQAATRWEEILRRLESIDRKLEQRERVGR